MTREQDVPNSRQSWTVVMESCRLFLGPVFADDESANKRNLLAVVDTDSAAKSL